MFSKIKILVIYFIIQSIYANVTSFTSEKTTLSVEEQVKKELSPIRENLKNIKDPSTNKDENMWLKGVIQGQFEKIIERAINAERENKMLNEDKTRLIVDKTRLQEKMDFISKPLGILSVCSRLETLVDDLYPVRRPFNIGIPTALQEILTSKDSKFANRTCIKIFRDRVKSYGISPENFVDAVRSLYGSFSDKAAHKMSAFEPQPPLYNDTEGIKKMLLNFGLSPDEGKVYAIQIILQPFPLST